MSKIKDSELSDEFQKHIKESRSHNRNFFGIIIAALAVILVFSFTGLAGYEIFFKTDRVENKSASEKIESKPTETTPVQNTTPVPAQQPAQTPASTQTAAADQTTNYTVVEGDVLGSIATKFNTTVAKLKSLNNITDENSLQIGQVIKVPKQ